MWTLFLFFIWFIMNCSVSVLGELCCVVLCCPPCLGEHLVVLKPSLFLQPASLAVTDPLPDLHSNNCGDGLQLWSPCAWSEADEFQWTHFHSTFIFTPVKLNFYNCKDFTNDCVCLAAAVVGWIPSARRKIKHPTQWGLNWCHYHMNGTKTKNSVRL